MGFWIDQDELAAWRRGSRGTGAQQGRKRLLDEDHIADQNGLSLKCWKEGSTSRADTHNQVDLERPKSEKH